MKSKKLVSMTLLGSLGLAYFAAFSALDINFIFKDYLVLVPVQLGVLVYLLWFRQTDKATTSASDTVPFSKKFD